ncbi:sugar ABC transporter substrate-binding protein [Amycolatopsis pithecellobii]|uniref:Substrate-binding domain-containing protein n=1 Tax=Amycolatopsis pithecellobii TaxID=664692 RepID=A0A6N7ZBP8_9PSEU|nr:sugar ABC transporter substrate-binding protein [Amycolatopsis pithecellobii]MTD59115.1 substrate-binding domain-containing protein [Amycolatopsis pithecellobii]
MRGNRVVAALLAGAVAWTLAGCGSSGDPGRASGTEAGTGSLEAKDNKEIVYISIGMSNAYDVAYRKSAKAELSRYGYTLTTLDANFDQSKSDQVVQQYLATGKTPAGFLWQPVDPSAGANSSRLLARRAPVLQVSQLPRSDAAFGYAATNQEAVGEQMGKLLLEARAKATSMGVKLHSSGGNLLYLDGTPGSPALDDRYRGIMKATQSAPFTMISRAAGGFDSDAGYKAANTTIPQFKGEGIDFIVAFNLGVASGAVRAAQQNGLALGQSTFLVAGDCGTGQMSQVASGLIYGTVVQSGYVEGLVSARSLVQRIATGKTTPDTVTLPVSATEPPLTATPPSQVTFMDVPAATATNLDTRYWGVTYNEACSGT